MWAVKPHYFSAHFYNWPYTFGLLFGLGLYARYRDDPERFRAGYDDLLRPAGIDDRRELAAASASTSRDEAFWTASLDVLRGPHRRLRGAGRCFAQWPPRPRTA